MSSMDYMRGGIDADDEVTLGRFNTPFWLATIAFNPHDEENSVSALTDDTCLDVPASVQILDEEELDRLENGDIDLDVTTTTNPTSSSSSTSPSSLCGVVFALLLKYDKWAASSHELFCFVYPLLVYGISIGLFASWEHGDLSGTLLYQSADLHRPVYMGFDLSAWMLALCVFNISAGAAGLLALFREVSLLSPKTFFSCGEKRLEFAARFYAMAPQMFFSATLLNAIIDPDDHSRRTRITVLAIWGLWATMFFMTASIACVFVHPSEPIFRPSILMPLLLALSSSTLLAQSMEVGLLQEKILSKTANANFSQSMFDLFGAWVVVALSHWLWNWTRHNQPLPSRFYDVITFSSCMAVWLTAYAFVPGLGQSKLVVLDPNFELRHWVALRLAPTCFWVSVCAGRTRDIILHRFRSLEELKGAQEEELRIISSLLNQEREEKLRIRQDFEAMMMERERKWERGGGVEGEEKDVGNDGGGGDVVAVIPTLVPFSSSSTPPLTPTDRLLQRLRSSRAAAARRGFRLQTSDECEY